MPRGKKKKKSNMYWLPELDDVIERYNNMEDGPEKEDLFRTRLYKPLDKLAENVINRFKFPYMDGTFEDIKAEVVSYLVLNLHKYDPTKGSKSFSYFSVIAKNYLILHNKKAYKKEKRSVYFGDTNDESFDLEEILLIDPEEAASRDDMKDFVNLFVRYWEHNIEKIFRKERDIKIAYAIVELLKRSDHIENFNKKALYVMLREITDQKTAHITKVVKKMRSQVRDQMYNFKHHGDFNDPMMHFIPNID